MLGEGASNLDHRLCWPIVSWGSLRVNQYFPRCDSKLWMFQENQMFCPPNLLVGGHWNHGMDYDFPETVGNGKSSQLLLTPSFFRGVGQPPFWSHLSAPGEDCGLQLPAARSRSTTESSGPVRVASKPAVGSLIRRQAEEKTGETRSNCLKKQSRPSTVSIPICSMYAPWCWYIYIYLPFLGYFSGLFTMVLVICGWSQEILAWYIGAWYSGTIPALSGCIYIYIYKYVYIYI